MLLVAACLAPWISVHSGYQLSNDPECHSIIETVAVPLEPQPGISYPSMAERSGIGEVGKIVHPAAAPAVKGGSQLLQSEIP